MKTHQKLKNIVKHLDKLTIKEFNENVFLIKFNVDIYVLKKIIIPFNKRELKSQHLFIDYLIKNKINVAKIFGCEKFNNKYYELQEYIENNQEINLENLIIAIAKFHNVSKLYQGKYKKRKIYKCNFVCKNIRLKYLLLDFKNKYYKFPMKNYKKNKKMINKKYKKYLEEIINIYVNFYKQFIVDYKLSSCVIHNDITSNNVINRDGDIYLIDFDLSIKGSEYVDFIDIIIKRYNTLEYICNQFDSIKKDIFNNIKVYNNYNLNINLEYKGVIKMLVLKLMAVNLYLMLNSNNIDKFENDFAYLYKIIKLCNKEVNDESNNYKKS